MLDDMYNLGRILDPQRRSERYLCSALPRARESNRWPLVWAEHGLETMQRVRS